MNYVITPTWVTKDTALFWDNSLKLVGNFDRQWNKEWNNKPKGSQIGDTVQVRTPQRWTVTEGQALIQQSILNQTVPLTLNHQYNVGMGWSSIEDTLQIEEVQDRYTMPAGVALANKTDAVAGAEVYQSIYNVVGTPGTPLVNKDWTDAVALLQMTGTPEGYVAVIDPLMQSELLNANFALFGKQYQEYFRTGQFSAMALGVDEWYYDAVLPIHNSGSFAASTPIVAGASQTGSVLNISGMGAYSLKKGDALYVVGTSAQGVNPLSYTSTGQPQRFVLTADVSGTGTLAAPISPAIIPSGQLQTVTGSPANGAAIQFVGATPAATPPQTMATTASRQQFLFNPAAFAFVSAPLTSDLPGARSKVVTNKDIKASLRWAEQWNIQTDQKPSRVDILIGVAAIEPYFAVRLLR
jgi:hypothetical protein